MNKIIKTGIIFLFSVCITGVSLFILPCHAQNAASQLEDAANTGTLFDGSDGDRFGTDTAIIDNSGSIPEVSPPEMVDDSSTSEPEESEPQEDTGSGNEPVAEDVDADSGATGTEPAE
jgi:hypothetical protein